MQNRHSSFPAAMHLGLICPELTGHLNPMTTLGRELQRRAHRVTVITRPDGRRKAEAAGLGFAPIAGDEVPEGSLAAGRGGRRRRSGGPAVQATAELLRRGAAAILQSAPEVVAREKIDALVVDQVARAGG